MAGTTGLEPATSAVTAERNRITYRKQASRMAISRETEDARIYTNNAETLGERLATDISKTAAFDLRQPSSSEQTRLAVEAFRNNDPATATERYSSRAGFTNTRTQIIA